MMLSFVSGMIHDAESAKIEKSQAKRWCSSVDDIVFHIASCSFGAVVIVIVYICLVRCATLQTYTHTIHG